LVFVRSFKIVGDDLIRNTGEKKALPSAFIPVRQVSYHSIQSEGDSTPLWIILGHGLKGVDNPYAVNA
jgi:hypothetical protein